MLLEREIVYDPPKGGGYKYIHDMKAVPATHYPANSHYLMLDAIVVWPNDPRRKEHRIFTIIMQYSKVEGEGVQNYPAHIEEEDAEHVLKEFQEFVRKCREDRPF